MSELRNLSNWHSMNSVIRDFQYEDWMGLAKSVSDMMAYFNGKLVDLSIENFVYNIKTKTSWILNKTEAQNDGDPIKLRWYPARVLKCPDNIVFCANKIAAFVVLEFMYGKSPFYHEDVETYKNNICQRIRTAGTPAPKDRKAAWMLMFTAFVDRKLTDGQEYLENLEMKEGRNPDEVIATWENKEHGWGPSYETIWYDVTIRGISEHDSISSPQPNTGSKELTPESNNADDLTQGNGQQETRADTQ